MPQNLYYTMIGGKTTSLSTYITTSLNTYTGIFIQETPSLCGQSSRFQLH